MENLEFKGTKGKWSPAYISGCCIGVESDTTIPGYTQMVVNTILPDTDKEYKKEKTEIEANATLIAAAPELLQALQNLVKWEAGTVNHVRAYQDANAAIQKALTLNK